MPEMYALEVAFSSDATAKNTTEPMAMAFGFCSAPVGGSWSESGQTAEKVIGGSAFFFAAYDIAPTPGTVNQLTIEFTGGKTPFVDQKGNQIPSPITVSSGQGLGQMGPNQPSPGTNMVGAKWLAGPYTLISQKGTYECTVTASVVDSAKNSKAFSVDPEVVVEGGGMPDVAGKGSYSTS